MGYNAAPYMSWLSQATLCDRSPPDAIDAYLTAAARPTDPPRIEKKRFGKSRQVASADDFRMTLSPGSHGWQYDAGHHGLGVWVFAHQDGSTILLASTWDDLPDSSGWGLKQTVETGTVMNLAREALGGRELRDENWTHDRFADEMQALISKSAIITPADMDRIRSGEKLFNE